MEAKIVDGKSLAKESESELKARIAELKQLQHS